MRNLSDTFRAIHLPTCDAEWYRGITRQKRANSTSRPCRTNTGGEPRQKQAAAAAGPRRGQCDPDPAPGRRRVRTIPERRRRKGPPGIRDKPPSGRKRHLRRTVAAAQTSRDTTRRLTDRSRNHPRRGEIMGRRPRPAAAMPCVGQRVTFRTGSARPHPAPRRPLRCVSRGSVR